MSYKVTTPLVIIPNVDGTTGDGYFYKDSVIPDGWNDDRCKQLVKEGMLEKVSAEAKNDGGDSKPSPAKDILAEVGDDKGKAQTALDEETAQAEPRKTLVTALQKVIEA